MPHTISTAEKYLFFGGLAIILAQALLIPFLWPLLNYLDLSLLALMLAGVYAIARRRGLPLYAIVGALIPIVAHSLGIMGAYQHFVLGLGYDKWMHFAAGVGITLFFYGLFDKLPFWERMLIAVLSSLGLGAINETMEFIGHFYFGIEQGGIFTFGDGLPRTGSALQLYDTYFDFLFQIGGCALSVLGISIQRGSGSSRRNGHR